MLSNIMEYQFFWEECCGGPLVAVLNRKITFHFFWPNKDLVWCASIYICLCQ